MNAITQLGWLQTVFIEASVLLVFLLACKRLGRSLSASKRSSVWSAGFVTLLVLPVLSCLEPRWSLLDQPVAEPETGSSDLGWRIERVANQERELAVSGGEASSGRVLASKESTSVSFWDAFARRLEPGLRIVFWVWMFGAGLIAVASARRCFRTRKIVKRAKSIREGLRSEIFEAMVDELGIRRRVRLLETAEYGVPFAVGCLRPSIVLPVGSDSWSRDKTQAVLRHELAHIKHGDSWLQLLALFLAPVYWMNPLFRPALRRMRIDHEKACDDRVIDAGIDPRTYAALLIEVTREAKRSTSPRTEFALSMETELETRLHSIVDSRRVREAPSAVAKWGIYGVTLLLGGAIVTFQLRGDGETDRPAASRNQESPPVAEEGGSSAENRPILADRKSAERSDAILDEIVLSEFFCDGLPLELVVKSLSDEFRSQHLTERVSISLLFDVREESVNSADPRLAGPPIVMPGMDIRKTLISMPAPLANPSLREVLDFIVQFASEDLEYRVVGRQVILSKRVPLLTRAYRVQLEDVIERHFGEQPAELARFKQAVTDGTHLNDLFQSLGFPGGLSAIYHRPESGKIYVRGTERQLAVVERVLNTLTHQPTKVFLEVAVYEIPMDSSRALGIDWLMGGTTLFQPTEVRRIQPGGLIPPSNPLVAPPSAGGEDAFWQGVLNPEQYGVMVRALEQREPVSLVASSRLQPLTRGATRVANLTLTAKRIRLWDPGEQRSMLTRVEVGPAFHIQPNLQGDTASLHLRIEASVSSLKPAKDPSDPAGGSASEAYELDQTRSLFDFVCRDDQTLIIKTPIRPDETGLAKSYVFMATVRESVSEPAQK